MSGHDTADMGFCWLLCLDIIRATSAELLQQAGICQADLAAGSHRLQVGCDGLGTLQVATEVALENAASQRYATGCLQWSLSAAGRYSSTDNMVAELSAGDQKLANMLRAISNANSTTSVAQLRQSVRQTEAYSAALERQMTQPSNGSLTFQEADGVVSQGIAGRGVTTATPLGKQQLSQKGTQNYVKAITASVACMIAQKQTQLQKGHSQQLQASWPLDVAPSLEQQGATSAQVSKGRAPLQSSSGLGPAGRPIMYKLQLQSLLSPINEGAASGEVQYWQKVAITVLGKKSVMALPDSVSGQLSKQQAAVTALQASPSGAYLACGGSLGKLVVLDVIRGICWVADASRPALAATPETAVAGS